jgi:hypothetical protein
MPARHPKGRPTPKRKRNSRKELPNCPLKLPVACLAAIGGFVLVRLGVADGDWGDEVVSGVIIIGLTLPSIYMILRRRNPPWLSGPIDEWWQRRRAARSDRRSRCAR